MLGLKSLCLAAAVAVVAIPAGTALAGDCGSSRRSISVHVDIGHRGYGHGHRARIDVRHSDRHGHADRHIDVHRHSDRHVIVERHYDRHHGHVDRHTVKRVETIDHGRRGYSGSRGHYRARSHGHCH